MKAIAKKAVLSGHITVPGSKSHTIRALILASMAEGVSHISNPLPSNDCLSTAKAVDQIGGKVIMVENVWTVNGAGKNLHLPENKIDVGNSGSLMYFLCPVLSTLKGKCTFTGDESICRRPVNHLIDSLNQLGAKAQCLENNSTPPFTFEGPIDVNKELVTGGELSQYISGFMMAATRLNGELKLSLTNPKETPYLTMTKMWLESVGAQVSVSDDFKSISVKGPLNIQGFDRAVPSDWEGVAFPLIAALITDSRIVIDNIDSSGSQGDDKIVEVLKSVGADIEWDKQKNQLTVQGGKTLSTKSLPDGVLKIDMSSFPDAICALAVIACFIEGKTIFTDIDICRKKETDRIKAMESELSKLGADIHDEGDVLVVNGNGGKKLCGGAVESYKDHRIVMALSCLGLALNEGEKLTVSDAQWCSVTFPNFFEEMNKLGANFELIEK